MSAKVSVVIPVYNVEKYLIECVDSVLLQTYENLEIILVDDGATDSSGEMCDEYAQKDSRIKVIHRKNGGLSAARNTGLDAASGEYIYFLDSDDWLKKETLQTLVDTAKKENSDVVFFDAFVFFTDCEEDPNVYKYERSKQYESAKGQDMLKELLFTDEYRTVVQLMLLRREYLKNNNLRFKEGILHEDELFTYLVYNADGMVTHCHKKLYARRIRPSSIMTGSSMLRRYDSMYKIYFELSDMYAKGELKGTVAKLYLARIARSVIGKYNLLTDEQKFEYADSFKSFKKDVMRHKGFGDIKLKIKCSGKISNIYYRLVNKFIK